jgi:hypothetical protein
LGIGHWALLFFFCSFAPPPLRPSAPLLPAPHLPIYLVSPPPKLATPGFLKLGQQDKFLSIRLALDGF